MEDDHRVRNERTEATMIPEGENDMKTESSHRDKSGEIIVGRGISE